MPIVNLLTEKQGLSSRQSGGGETVTMRLQVVATSFVLDTILNGNPLGSNQKGISTPWKMVNQQ